MGNLEVILSTLGTILGVVTAAVTFLMKWIKNAKAKKVAETILTISNAVLPYVKQAEEFSNYSGAEKKEYVITKANQFAIENGLNFDVEQVSAKIEELVELTKSVNMREKDALCSAISKNATEYCDCMKKPIEEITAQSEVK